MISFFRAKNDKFCVFSLILLSRKEKNQVKSKESIKNYKNDLLQDSSTVCRQAGGLAEPRRGFMFLMPS
jgi:hypothetical protein